MKHFWRFSKFEKLDDKTKAFIREWAETIVIAVVLALFIRTFFVQAFKIPSGSMRMTLLEGDRILVNKLIYRFKEPARGDIVVFRYPEDRKKDFIKRLIAKGGEAVEIKNGDIYINGEIIEDPPAIRSTTYYNKEPYGGVDKKIRVPDGQFYVLGDNSAHSRDSRYWGFVPRKDVLGRGFFVYWPLTRIRVLK